MKVERASSSPEVEEFASSSEFARRGGFQLHPHEGWRESVAEYKEKQIEQGPFLKRLVDEASLQETVGKEIHGRHITPIQKILKDTHKQLLRLDPSFTLEHLRPIDYASPEVGRQLESLAYNKAKGLEEIIGWQLKRLESYGEQLGMADDTEPFVLSIPEFFSQGESGCAKSRRQGCMNACFRMVYNDIAGEKPHERVLVDAMEDRYNSFLVDDVAYLNIFQTPAFQETYTDSKVELKSMTGIDLAAFSKLAKAKKANPHMDMYAIVMLHSETANKSFVLHTNVLLGTTEDRVVVHDPSLTKGGAQKAMSRLEFYRRWAVSMNKAYLVIRRDA